MSFVMRGAAALAVLAASMACGEGSNDRNDSDRRDSDSAADAVTSVLLRLSNASGVSFDDVLVQVGDPIEFGALDAGTVSEYLQADGIYSYAYVEGTSGDQSFIFQPTDYTGDTMLSPGYYTYVLSVPMPSFMEQPGSLDLRMVRDVAPR